MLSVFGSRYYDTQTQDPSIGRDHAQHLSRGTQIYEEATLNVVEENGRIDGYRIGLAKPFPRLCSHGNRPLSSAVERHDEAPSSPSPNSESVHDVKVVKQKWKSEEGGIRSASVKKGKMGRVLRISWSNGRNSVLCAFACASHQLSEVRSLDLPSPNCVHVGRCGLFVGWSYVTLRVTTTWNAL